MQRCDAAHGYSDNLCLDDGAGCKVEGVVASAAARAFIAKTPVCGSAGLGSGDVDVVVEGRDRQEIFAAGAVVLRVGVVLFVVFGGLVETPEDRMSFVDVYRARQGA